MLNKLRHLICFEISMLFFFALRNSVTWGEMCNRYWTCSCGLSAGFTAWLESRFHWISCWRWRV